jgi:transglutaminase-like putative cysteine protease
MHLKTPFLFVSILFFPFSIFAQNKASVKFGRISPDDFAKKVYNIDSNASAIVIADIGSSEIIGNTKGWFSLEFKRYRRVHILNKNGYDEANVEVKLYSNGDREEELNSVKAVTYNLENGKVVETKLEKNGIFKDKIDKRRVIKKFTFPNIKEGSIIEYEYTVQSDFLFNLQPWEFQGQSPVLWSEYNLRLPEFLGYVFLKQGYRTYDISERKDNRSNFTIRDTRTAGATESISFVANVTDYHWVMKEVPELKQESFTSTLKNHIAKIEFQLSDYRYPLTPQNVMGTWTKLSNDLLHAEYFGNGLEKNNGWLGDVIDPLTADAKDNVEKAKKIYAYVRDNLTCTSHNATDLDQSLKNVLKTRNGTVAEINLLLIAMLKYANIQADPVILSTRSHGYTYSMYPIIDKFNYVVCDVNINGQNYFLDASEPRLGFGRLTPACYNGHARVINDEATALEFSSDSLMERKLTSIILTSNEKGEMMGSLRQVLGYYESYNIREKIKEKGKDEFFKDIKKAYAQDMELVHPNIDSLDNLEESIAITYDFKLNEEEQDIIYINPMFGEAYKENYFKSAERFYPVEMPYAFDKTYIFSMIIPEGYIVDELPKSIIVKLNEQGDGQFEYRISESGGTISMRSRVQLKRAYYMPDEYEILREFFNLIVKKHSEQIVLKKKK